LKNKGASNSTRPRPSAYFSNIQDSWGGKNEGDSPNSKRYSYLDCQEGGFIPRREFPSSNKNKGEEWKGIKKSKAQGGKKNAEDKKLRINDRRTDSFSSRHH